MDWIFSEKPDPATPPVSWALGAIPAMFRRETPHFERDLGRLRAGGSSDRNRDDQEPAGHVTTDHTGHVTAGLNEPTFDNLYDMKASSTPFFKPEKVHLKRRAGGDFKTSPNKFPRTGGILKQTKVGGGVNGGHGEDTTAKNVSFAASLGSTTNSISEQLPEDYEGADQTPVASCRAPKFVQYDPVNDDTKTMFRKLDNGLDLLNERRLKWGGRGGTNWGVQNEVQKAQNGLNGVQNVQKEVQNVQNEFQNVQKVQKEVPNIQNEFQNVQRAQMEDPASLEPPMAKSTTQIELELALNKIKQLETDKRKYMTQSNQFEMEKRTVQHELDMLKHQHRNDTDTLKMTIEHLQSKMSVSGCETRVTEHKLGVAETRTAELQRELESRTAELAEVRSVGEQQLREQEQQLGELVDDKVSSEQREQHLKEQVLFLTEKVASLERKERAYRASEKIAMRQREDFNRNWTFRNGAQSGLNEFQNDFRNQGNLGQNDFRNQGNQGQTDFRNHQNQNDFNDGFNRSNGSQNSQQRFDAFNQPTNIFKQQNNQPNYFDQPNNQETHANPLTTSQRQPLHFIDLNVKRNTAQKPFGHNRHNRQPSTTPKQPPPSYLRGNDVEMNEGMRFYR